jgi:hypothetical protein
MVKIPEFPDVALTDVWLYQEKNLMMAYSHNE